MLQEVKLKLFTNDLNANLFQSDVNDQNKVGPYILSIVMVSRKGLKSVYLRNKLRMNEKCLRDPPDDFFYYLQKQ